MNCRHSSACPGCPLIDRPYEAQLQIKRQRLVSALARYPHLTLPTPEPIIAAVRTEGYRHRLKLPVHVGKQHVSIGLYDAQHRVLDTPDCPVLAEELRSALPVIARWLRTERAAHSIDLRLSHATGALSLSVATRGGQLASGHRGARALRRELPALASVAVSSADPQGKRVMGRAPSVVAGAAFIEERIGSTRYRLYPGAFFQVDPLQAERIHARVREMVGNAQTVLDLYAGVGAYGLMLAEGRKRVLLVEEVDAAVESARAMAPGNVQIIGSKVEEVAFDTPFDVAILNPARRGSDPATLKRLSESAERLIYVSCGPETLARDLDCLASFGMHADRIVPIDLFPQTPEVETIVHLRRGTELRDWPVQGGRARAPWQDHPSGATGKPAVVTALLIGDLRARGQLSTGTFTRIGTVATHSLVRLELKGALSRALSELTSWGHPVAGADRRTAPFFSEKAGLLRPFVHIDADTSGAHAPLHGDLEEAIARLGGIARGEGSNRAPRPRKIPRTRTGRRR